MFRRRREIFVKNNNALNAQPNRSVTTQGTERGEVAWVIFLGAWNVLKCIKAVSIENFLGARLFWGAPSLGSSLPPLAKGLGQTLK